VSGAVPGSPLAVLAPDPVAALRAALTQLQKNLQGLYAHVSTAITGALVGCETTEYVCVLPKCGGKLVCDPAKVDELRKLNADNVYNSLSCELCKTEVRGMVASYHAVSVLWDAAGMGSPPLDDDKAAIAAYMLRLGTAAGTIYPPEGAFDVPRVDSPAVRRWVAHLAYLQHLKLTHDHYAACHAKTVHCKANKPQDVLVPGCIRAFLRRYGDDKLVVVTSAMSVDEMLEVVYPAAAVVASQAVGSAPVPAPATSTVVVSQAVGSAPAPASAALAAWPLPGGSGALPAHRLLLRMTPSPAPVFLK